MDDARRILLLLSIALSSVCVSSNSTVAEGDGGGEYEEMDESPAHPMVAVFGVIFMLAGVTTCMVSFSATREYEKEMDNLKANGVKVDAIVTQKFTETRSGGGGEHGAGSSTTYYWVVVEYTVRTNRGTINISKKKLSVDHDDYEPVQDGQTVKVVVHKDFPKWAKLASELDKKGGAEKACLGCFSVCFGGVFLAAGTAVTILILVNAEESPTAAAAVCVVVFLIGVYASYAGSKKCVQVKINQEKNDSEAIEMMDRS